MMVYKNQEETAMLIVSGTMINKDTSWELIKETKIKTDEHFVIPAKNVKAMELSKTEIIIHYIEKINSILYVNIQTHDVFFNENYRCIVVAGVSSFRIKIMNKEGILVAPNSVKGEIVFHSKFTRSINNV